MKRILPILFVLLGGCAMEHNVNLSPIHVAPIRVEMDVNVNVNEHEDATSGGDAPRPSADAGAAHEAQRTAPSRAIDG